MSLLTGLRKELEATELQPIQVEVDEKQLQKIAIYVVAMGLILFILKSIIQNLIPGK